LLLSILFILLCFKIIFALLKDQHFGFRLTLSSIRHCFSPPILVSFKSVFTAVGRLLVRGLLLGHDDRIVWLKLEAYLRVRSLNLERPLTVPTNSRFQLLVFFQILSVVQSHRFYFKYL
jgi:hypothetical protein